MKMVFDKKINKSFSKFLIFAFFWCCFFIVSMQTRKIGGDDTNFTNQILDVGGVNWVLARYNNWSGRFFSDSMTAFFLPKSQILWAISNSFFATLLLYSINKLAFQKYSNLFFSMASLGYISLGILVDSSFWITGSFNYLWPISLGLFSLILVSNSYRNKKTRYPAIYIACAILASFGVEQLTACLVCFSILANLKVAFSERAFRPSLFLYSFFTAMSSAIVILSPGSKNRVLEDSARWYPDFIHMSLLDKITSGVTWQFDYWITYMSGTIVLLVFIIFIVQIKKQNVSKFEKLSSKILFALLAIAASLSISVIPVNLTEFVNFNDASLASFFPYFFWSMFFIVVYSLAIHLSPDTIESAFLVAAIFLSAALMYFSPTIYASGPRSLAVPFVLHTILIGKIASNHIEIILNYRYLLYICPLINIGYFLYWASQGIQAHSFVFN